MAEKPRIVVLGGSFNPPTIAHEQTMLCAMRSCGAEKGIFVPSNEAYVARKMRRLKASDHLLPEQTRLAMLQSICGRHNGMLATNLEYRLPQHSRTYDTMCRIQEQYPGYALLFIVGSDKLRVLPRWYRINDFLINFRILIAARAEDNVQALLANDKLLSRYPDAFLIFQPPKEAANISSSKFRLLADKNPELAKPMVPPEVWDLYQNHP